VISPQGDSNCLLVRVIPRSLAGDGYTLIEENTHEADEIAGALRFAGAVVLGPYREPTSALRRIASSQPACAIVEWSLGQGVLNIANALKDKRIPLLFLISRESGQVPPDFGDALS
jgi:hypothetical protein